LPADFDPHKPYIDRYDWDCKCGGTLRRATEVIDTWFDSGSMPYAQWHYPFEHQAEFASHFPAHYICEGVDQTRGWFYSLLAIAVTVFDSPAYQNVIVNGHVVDADGQKMSKSRGNVVDPWEAMAEFGADTIRLYLVASSQVGCRRVSIASRSCPAWGSSPTRSGIPTSSSPTMPAIGTPEQAAVNLDRSDRWILDRLDVATTGRDRVARRL
jgi:isoleucyl-tRNA synthetase